MQAAVKLPDAIVTLCDEHRYMNLLLETLEEKLQQEGRISADHYYLLQDIVTYLHKYSDVSHHPTEDLMFERLIERDPSTLSDVQSLQNDHEKLTSNNGEILELLKIASTHRSEESNDAVQIAIKAYASALKKHMQREESELFPRAVRCLGHNDWRSIEIQLANLEDPLFGQRIGKEYRVLYEFFSDRADKLAQRMSRRGFLQLDNFIVSADAFENGIGDLWHTLHAHAEAIADTSRETVKRTFGGGGMKSALNAQAEFIAFLGKKAFDVGSDSAKLSAQTLKKMLLPFFSGKNRAQ